MRWLLVLRLLIRRIRWFRYREGRAWAYSSRYMRTMREASGRLSPPAKGPEQNFVRVGAYRRGGLGESDGGDRAIANGVLVEVLLDVLNDNFHGRFFGG